MDAKLKWKNKKIQAAARAYSERKLLKKSKLKINSKIILKIIMTNCKL